MHVVIVKMNGIRLDLFDLDSFILVLSGNLLSLVPFHFTSRPFLVIYSVLLSVGD